MKKKKWLLALSVGAIMATTPLVTACSSDIKFNQSDLDNAIKNVNDYLETQNNYSSEFAKNVLNDYLLRGIERNQNNSQFGYKITNQVQNSFSDSYASYTIDYKIFRQNNTIKELCNIAGDEEFPSNGLNTNTKNYRETISEYKSIETEPGSGVMTKGKNYYYTGSVFTEDLTKTSNQYSKTTFENKTKTELSDWQFFGDLSNIYTNLMLAVVTPEASSFGMGNYFSNQTDVIMGQDGEFETFAFTNVFAETQDGEVVILSFNVKFKDGVLHSISFTNSMKNSYYSSLQNSQVLTIEISEKIDDFTFDKSNY